MSGTRIVWIDNAKIVAGILMFLDHALLYFGHEGSWIRYTITRCVEPLYVFCFAYVLSAKGRGLSPKRWRQLAVAAVIETAIHSHRESVLYFGILANLTCFAWLVGALRRLSNPWLVILAVSGSAFAVFPMGGTTCYIDYGPRLLVSQFSFAILAARRNGLVATTLAACWLATLLASGFLVGLDTLPSSAVWTIVIGHPLAASLLVCSRQETLACRQTRSVMVSHPMKFYVSHLVILHTIAIVDL